MNELITQLQNEVLFLRNELEDLQYKLNKLLGGGSAEVRARIVNPSTVNATIAADSVTQAMIAAAAVGQSELKYEEVTVNVTAGQTSGTGAATSGSVIVGYRPSGNVDQAIDSIAISGTTVTVTLGAAATAQNNFVVILLKA